MQTEAQLQDAERAERQSWTIYLAGPLFGIADRVHNLLLERELRKLGYRVILPQREASNFLTSDGFDIDALKDDCMDKACDAKNITVANIDGPDADSGTVVESTGALVTNKRAVLVRTDFRTDSNKEIGINAMLRLPGSKLVWKPSFTLVEYDDIPKFYESLAMEIHKSIQVLRENKNYRERLKLQAAA